MRSFPGVPWYIDRQAVRLGCTIPLAKAAYVNKELYQTGTLLAQLSERIQRAKKGANGRPEFDYTERRQLDDALKTIENRHCQLHVIAGAADAMLAEAYDALSIMPPRRRYEILAESDAPPALPARPVDVEISDRVLAGVVG